MHKRRFITFLLAWTCALTAPSFAASTVPEAITAAANKLVSTQLANGDWPVDYDTTFPGAMTAGLGDAYLLTGVAAYKTSALKGADRILAIAGGSFLGEEAWGLTLASQIHAAPDSNKYRTALNSFYNEYVPALPGGTAGYINYLVNYYTTANGEQSETVYYLAQHMAAAAYVNSPDLPAWRAGVISTLAQVDDDGDYYSLKAASVALWALAQTGPLDNTLISSTGFWAGKRVSDLPGMIAARRVTSGSSAGAFYGEFTYTRYVGYTVDSAYGIKALASGGPYTTQALAGKTWLANGISAQGLYTELAGAGGATYYVYTGQALQGLAAPFHARWNGGSGNWSDGTKWNVGQAPSNNAAANTYFDVTISTGVANLDMASSMRLLKVQGGTVTGTGSVTVAGGMINGNYSVSGTTTVSLGTLVFAGGTNYANLAGPGTASVSSGATLVMGPSTIASVVNNGNVAFNPAGSSSMAAPFSGGGTITHMGGGTTTLTGYAGTGSMALQTGTLVFPTTAAPRGTSGVLLRMRSLTMGNGTALEVTNHDLMIGNASMTAVETAILAAYGAGGTGAAAITGATSLEQYPTMLVPVNADVKFGNGSPGSAVGHVFDGVAITEPGTVLVKYTYMGDLNLDGQVDAADFTIANGHLGQATPELAGWAAAWVWGDVTLDGVVNGLDLATIAGNFNAGVAPPLGPMVAGSTAVVPEASTVLLLGLGAAGLLRRRRRVWGT